MSGYTGALGELMSFSWVSDLKIHVSNQYFELTPRFQPWKISAPFRWNGRAELGTDGVHSN